MRKSDWRDFHEKYHSTSYLRKIDRSHAPLRLMISEEASKVGKSILDVGCLSCIDYPIHQNSNLDYTGVDVAPKFLAHAKKLYPGIDARLGDILDLPFHDLSFDTAYSKDVVEMLPPGEWKQAVKELWRVSRKLMMIAFCEPPWDAPTNHSITRRGKLICWVNRYNKPDFVEYLKALPCLVSLEVREPIKSLTGRDLALYIVRKKNG